MSETKKIGEFTMETFDFEEWPEVVRTAFIIAITDGTEHPKKFFAGREVLLVINGRQFSFERVMARFNEAVDLEIEKVARKKAEERIKLSYIAERMYDLSYRIDEELDRLFPSTAPRDD